MKVAVLGYGYWGPNQVRTFGSVLGFDRVVVVDPLDARLEAASASCPGVGLEHDFESVLDDPAIQAVCLCTPAVTHTKLARQALERGKHVLVEKPLTTGFADARGLVEIADRASRVLMVGHVFLYSAAVRQLQFLLASNELGALRYLYSSRTSLGPRAREDINIVWDYLIHDVYIVHSLLGEPEEVAAHGDAYLRPGIADVVFATLRFRSGELANLHASWYDPNKIRRMTLVGTDRMAVYDESCAPRAVTIYDRGYAPSAGRDSWGNLDLRLYDDGERAVDTCGPEPLREQCLDFLQAISTGSRPVADASSAVAVTRILETVDTSLAHGGASVRLADCVALT